MAPYATSLHNTLSHRVVLLKNKIVGLARDIMALYHEAENAAKPGQESGASDSADQRLAGLVRVLGGTEQEEGEEEVQRALATLAQLMTDTADGLTAYELLSSGLVPAVRRYLRRSGTNGRRLFVRHLSRAGAAVCLVRKLVQALEQVEKLPVHVFDANLNSQGLPSGLGAAYGVQAVTRRLRLRLERAPDEDGLYDRTGKFLKVEQLVTVAQMEEHLVKMTAKQW